jgi:CDP-6-deoxy-D-xylo-4-hexulose-3-dehydrase
MTTQATSTSPGERKIHYGQACYGEAEIAAAQAVLENQALTLMDGPQVARFEQRVAALFGKAHGLMVNSGSSANLLAIAALSIPRGAEVITPALNWPTTVAPILQHGLVPAFVDVEPDTFVIDAAKVEAMIGPRTRAIVVPDLVGNIAEWDRLAEIARRHGLLTVHDSADTIGATYLGRPTGSWSDITTTSFYASHIITCAGFGGMLCCNDPNLLRLAKLLRGWGRRSSLTEESESLEFRLASSVDSQAYDGKFTFDAQGYNLLPSEIGAAFGLEQLKRLPGFIETRMRNFATLRRHFESYQDWIQLPRQRSGSRTAWHAFAMVVRPEAPFDRTELQVFFEQRGIQTRPVFAGNILRHPGFARMECHLADAGYPCADRVMEGGIMVGCHQGLGEEDIDYVVHCFERFAERHGGRRHAPRVEGAVAP